MAPRLVSPCVSYRHSDFWEPSSQVWRSQLGQASGKYSREDLRITVRMGEKPWLLTVVADHIQSGVAESVLRELAVETESQLFERPQDAEAVTSRAREANDTAMDPDSLMVEFHTTLTQLEELLAACENEADDKRGDIDRMSSGSRFDRPRQVTGTCPASPLRACPILPGLILSTIDPVTACRSAPRGAERLNRRILNFKQSPEKPNELPCC